MIGPISIGAIVLVIAVTLLSTPKVSSLAGIKLDDRTELNVYARGDSRAIRRELAEKRSAISAAIRATLLQRVSSTGDRYYLETFFHQHYPEFLSMVETSINENLTSGKVSHVEMGMNVDHVEAQATP